MHTVFQIAGPETPGLLAEVTQLLSHNGLEIRTAAVSNGRRCHHHIFKRLHHPAGVDWFC